MVLIGINNMQCKHDPKETIGPIGMYHCPECGDMVLAGMDHPDYDECYARYHEYVDKKMEQMMLWLNERLNSEDFLNITQSMKNVLIEMWLRCDINEDQKCVFCSRNVSGNFIYCTEACSKMDEYQSIAEAWKHEVQADKPAIDALRAALSQRVIYGRARSAMFMASAGRSRLKIVVALASGFLDRSPKILTR